ncbi:Hypothetical predicted protein, partial [Mytilus galloprovincialis]
SKTDVPFNRTYPLSGVSSSNPEPNVARLNYTDNSFAINIEHGDNLTITARVQSGGYEILRNINDNTKRTVMYNGQESEKTMIFHFDFEPSYHCSEKRHCSESPISIGPDITKQNLSISWQGWHDDLGGVFRYNWEIHHLKADALGSLKEVSPMRPLYSDAILKTNFSPPIFYTPPEPGMYSIILDVADKANNSRFARQFVLYDPVSNITTDETSELFVSSAEQETHYHWQSNVQNQTHYGPPLHVSWKGHFRNKFHEDNKLLNAILPFDVVAMDGMYFKKINDSLDDFSGTRTRKAVPNIHGIVWFEIAYDVDHQGGKTITVIPSRWKDVDNFLHENQTIDVKRSDGDTVRIWVRSKDIMGNIKVDSTVVHIDTTPPTITGDVEIDRNVNSTKFHFASR